MRSPEPLRSLARESQRLTAMIRITTHHELSHTVVTIDGRLTAADFPEVRRVHESIGGAVALDLAGLDTCARDGIRLLQDWLDAGACLDAATPFLRMVLRDRKAQDSRTEPLVIPGPDSSNEPP